jgi:hypothetical protein
LRLRPGDEADEDRIFLSVINLAEIRLGIDKSSSI